jgi:hypothetical protein
MTKYAYLTKKQAGIVYAAMKRGDVTMSKKQVRDMYDMVGDPKANYYHIDNAVGHIINGRLDMAQAEIDGKYTKCVTVVTSVEKVLVTEENWLDFIFEEIGEYAEVEHTELVWKVCE